MTLSDDLIRDHPHALYVSILPNARYTNFVCQGISILADVWHAPSSKQAIGTATTGSSEAIQLGGLAMKKIWQAKRKAAGKSIHEPGLVILTCFSIYQTIFSGLILSWVQTLRLH